MTRRYDIQKGAAYGFCDFLPHPVFVTKALFNSREFNRIIDDHLHVENDNREHYVRPDPPIENRDDFICGYYFGVAGAALPTIATMGLITVGIKFISPKMDDKIRRLELLPRSDIKELPEDKS